MGAGILAFASIATSLVSTGLSIYGQNQQAKSATQAAKYNNQLAQAEATNLANESREAQTRERQQNRKQMAQLRLSLGQQGTQNSSGTPLAIIGESQQNFSLGIADAARRTDMQTAALRAKGQMGLWEADNFKRASKLQMFGTAIGGISSAVQGYGQFKYTGALK
jgi:hypothetical protein